MCILYTYISLCVYPFVPMLLYAYWIFQSSAYAHTVMPILHDSFLIPFVTLQPTCYYDVFYCLYQALGPHPSLLVTLCPIVIASMWVGGCIICRFLCPAWLNPSTRLGDFPHTNIFIAVTEITKCATAHDGDKRLKIGRKRRSQAIKPVWRGAIKSQSVITHVVTCVGEWAGATAGVKYIQPTKITCTCFKIHQCTAGLKWRINWRVKQKL